MTIGPSFPMIISFVVVPIIIEDEQVVDFEQVVVNENTPENNHDDGHKAMSRKEKDKEVSQVLTLIPQPPLSFMNE